jgi:hypothetical protein
VIVRRSYINDQEAALHALAILFEVDRSTSASPRKRRYSMMPTSPRGQRPMESMTVASHG